MHIPEFSLRLRMARAHADLTQGELAKIVGCTQGNISKLENEKPTGSELTVQLALACRVSPQWLATGAGDIRQSELSPDEIDLIKLYRACSKEGQRSVIEVSRVFASAETQVDSE